MDIEQLKLDYKCNLVNVTLPALSVHLLGLPILFNAFFLPIFSVTSVK